MDRGDVLCPQEIKGGSHDVQRDNSVVETDHKREKGRCRGQSSVEGEVQSSIVFMAGNAVTQAVA